jgi:uncharacterized protein YbcI
MEAVPEPGAPQPQGLVLQDLSNEMVRLYKDLFGRGPTKVRSSFVEPDGVMCTLENTFTPAERKLAEMGEHQRLRDVRLFFQYSSERDFRDTVQRVTGRPVRAFISGIDTEKDIAVELFYLEPEDGAGPPG